MLGPLLFYFTGRRLVLYNKHRQSVPIVMDKFNRKAYFFINDSWMWRYVPFRSTSKWKYRIIYIILNFLRPHIILDINWINLKGGFYHLWAKNNRPSKYVVLQHGSYVGGIVTDIAHRYTHCDEFLTWGEHFTNYFVRVNCNKAVAIKTFGNPVFNKINRSSFKYPNKARIKKLLIAPSAVSLDRKLNYIELMSSLARTDLEVWFKPHSMQNKIGGDFDIPEEVSFYSGENLWSDFDFLISDISTMLLDACFFKKLALFFMPYHAESCFNNTVYARFMRNLANVDVEFESSEYLLGLVDVKAQENLFKFMVMNGDNKIV